MSKYPKSEYSHTHKQSTAAALTRAQGGGEQLRRMTPDEYIRSRNGKASDGNRK